ncbi:MAG: glycyl-radical enzyme activating protein [Ruminococcaceae bacterium]|nr:glycyl-radical enzyme activating protein [Oscillospiraceae bacterium]
MNSSEGFIFDIYRGTTHDGPGMRTTVFFKGCPLHCAWCHNPESISLNQQIWWEQMQCIGCGECEKACSLSAVKLTETGVKFDRDKCVLCGGCAKVCPTKAISFVGRNVTVDALFKEVKKYQAYYKTYGGGVTASGGEPLLQHTFVKNLFELAHEEGIHTALDTSGAVSFDAFEEVLPFTDCVLYDIKTVDKNLHKEYIGSDNKLILDNILKIAENIRNGEKYELWIRTPLIPLFTASEQNISEIAVFIKENLMDVISRWEMCTFNKACLNKYERLDLNWKCKDAPVIRSSDIENIKKTVENTGFDMNKLVISGLIAD